MRRITAAALGLSMSISATPLVAAQAGTSVILGTAKTSAGRTVGNTSVRLRNLASNQLAGTTVSDASGAFGFSGLEAGNYVVEVVNAAGEIIGTSTSLAVGAGATLTGVAVTASVVGAAVGGGLGTVAITSIVLAATAGTVAAVTVVKSDASPSK